MFALNNHIYAVLLQESSRLMDLHLYLNIRLIIASIMLTLAAGLFFGMIPQKLRGTIYDSSRKIMAVALSVLPIATMLVYFLGLRYDNMIDHLILFFISCYVTALLVTISLISLLGNKLNYRDYRFIISVAVGVLMPAPLIAAYFHNDPFVLELAIQATAVFLFAAILLQCTIFHKAYITAIRRVNNYYSDDVEVKIEWINKSAYLLFSAQIICSLSAFYLTMHLWLEVIITFFRLFVTFYVFKSFIKFILDYVYTSKIIETTIREPEIDVDSNAYRSLNHDIIKTINTRLNAWINEQRFTTKGLTIETVASEIYTNRTYLSTYINGTYKCSFKAWITMLRIDYSKQLLKYNINTTIEDISNTVGFASSASYIQTFKRLEDCTPAQWRINSTIIENSGDLDVSDSNELLTSH